MPTEPALTIKQAMFCRERTTDNGYWSLGVPVHQLDVHKVISLLGDHVP
jgi:hypothetical protein